MTGKNLVTAYSVVIPAYNAERTIAEAIQSVLEQTVPPRHIIVVDDGSNDATARIAAEFRDVEVIKQVNQGPGAATNAGFARCTTPLIATLDADDIWLPTKIAEQLAALHANPDIAVVFCRLANFYHDPADADFPRARGGWSRSTMLIYREHVRAIGDIVDQPGNVGEMVDWFARHIERGHKFMLLEAPLALRRIHPGSLTFRNPDLASGYLQVARAALLRRRKRPPEE